jgi:hypothetical protein
MRRLLVLACRAFPRDHRARRSDEVVDTASLVADGSRGRATREALSLVLGGIRERLRVESNCSFRDGLRLLAGVLAVVNLAVAIVGPGLRAWASGFGYSGYQHLPGWWWFALPIAAAGVVLGLMVGDRRLALGAALANLGLLVYHAFAPWQHHGPFDPVAMIRVYGASFPAGREWLAPAVVLALATAAAPLRRIPLTRVPLLAGVVWALVALAQETAPRADFTFLRWPLAALMLVTVAFGWLLPRLAVMTVGLVLAAGFHVGRAAMWSVTAVFVLWAFMPVARVVRRRLT